MKAKADIRGQTNKVMRLNMSFLQELTAIKSSVKHNSVPITWLWHVVLVMVSSSSSCRFSVTTLACTQCNNKSEEHLWLCLCCFMTTTECFAEINQSKVTWQLRVEYISCLSLWMMSDDNNFNFIQNHNMQQWKIPLEDALLQKKNLIYGVVSL